MKVPTAQQLIHRAQKMAAPSSRATVMRYRAGLMAADWQNERRWREAAASTTAEINQAIERYYTERLVEHARQQAQQRGGEHLPN